MVIIKMSTVNVLREKVIKYVVSQIKHGKLQPGQIINEVKISSDLNISRTPVREALFSLIADGVLQKVPRKGYTPVTFSRQQKNNIHNIIGALDSLAATLAMEYITQKDITKMCEIADKIDIAIRYKNYEDYFDLQDEFHKIYINKCENPPLIKLLETIKSGPIQYTYTSKDIDSLFIILAETHQQHREIIRLFEAKDSASLEKYLKYTHWHTTHPDFI